PARPAFDEMSNLNQFWNQLYQPATFAQLVQGAIQQAPFNPHAHGYQQPPPAFVNNNFQNGFQNPAIHPALLNHNFHVGTQNAAVQNTGNQNHIFQQNPGNQNPVVPQMPAIQNVPAINTVSRPKALRRKRVTKKPKPKPLQPLGDAPFLFMELPLEIRLMVYKLLLEETYTALTLLTQGHSEQEVVRRGCLKKQPKNHGGRQILKKTVYKANDEGITHLQPAILRVCKPIYDEAISILYRQTLEFEHPIALQKFLFTIGPNNRLLLLNIVLRGWQDGEFPVWQQAFASAFDRLLTAQNLRSIGMDRHIYSSSDTPVIYRDPWKLTPVKHFN
ncbi:hypothetical protein KCU90_g25754, partial [Aureobasidium melanogenum]